MFAEYLQTHDLGALLCAPGAYHPYPRCADRAAWEGLAEEKRRAIAAWGDEALGGYPMLTATQFLAFTRSGNRQVYETPYFRRRELLMGAAIAECLCNDGAYLDAVIDGLWCICEESTWVLSAHNGSEHPGVPPISERPLPDVTNPYVDLFAAQTAAALADVLELLENKLDAVSPLIARRVRSEIDRRVITPFLTHDDFWWMGMIRHDMCNWTPWIVSNVIEVLLLLERDKYRRSGGIARGMRMLDSYLAVLPDDGGCDEGAAYFNMAGAALFDALESVYEATAGRVSFFGEPLIRRIGDFPVKAHVAGEYFINFADCDVKPRLDGERLMRFGERTENPQLVALGAQMLAQNAGVRPLDTPQMNRVLHALFEKAADLPPAQEEAFGALPDLQVFSWRKGGLYAAIKGGHNRENHNHNDVGSFIVYADGKPQIVDMGNCVYTAKTFGPERYTLMNTRARNHNVPLIGGTEQAFGRQYAARDVRADALGAQMDIAGAYPAQAGVLSLKRALRIGDAGITLQDTVRLSAPQQVTWVFMLREKPALGEGRVCFGPLTLRYDGKLTARAEEIPVTDARMARNFPGSLWRLTLTGKPGCEQKQSFSIGRI